MSQWIQWWVNQSDAVIVLSLMALFLSLSALIVWACFHTRLVAFVRSFKGIVAPFIAVGSLLFALVTGFLGASTWGRFNEADVATREEAAAALHLIGLGQTLPAFREAGFGDLTDDYLQTVVSKEWPGLGRREQSAEATMAFQRLRAKVLEVVAGNAGGAVLSEELLRAFNELSRARLKRVSIAQAGVHSVRWIGVVMLGLLAQVGIAVVHLDHKRAMSLALFISSLVFVTALSMIALSESAFSGSMSVSSTPLQRALDRDPVAR